MTNFELNLNQTDAQKLLKCVRYIHRCTEDMTVQELRKAGHGQSGAWLPCIFSFSDTKAGNLKKIDFEIVTNKPAKDVLEGDYSGGFAAQVDLFYSPNFVACGVASAFANKRIKQFVAARKDADIREYAHLSDSALTHELSVLNGAAGKLNEFDVEYDNQCEKLRWELLKQEAELRKGESNHMRLTAISKNKLFLAAREKHSTRELEKASDWQVSSEFPRYQSYLVPTALHGLEPQRQLLIAYRNDTGWRFR